MLPDWPRFLDDFRRHWLTEEDHVYVDFVRDGVAGRATRTNRLFRKYAESIIDWPGLSSALPWSPLALPANSLTACGASIDRKPHSPDEPKRAPGQGPKAGCVGVRLSKKQTHDRSWPCSSIHLGNVGFLLRNREFSSKMPLISANKIK